LAWSQYNVSGVSIMCLGKMFIPIGTGICGIWYSMDYMSRFASNSGPI